MKLRIQGNSLRLRLTRNEVATVRDSGRIESRIEFSAGQALIYRLESSSRAKFVTAAFNSQAIHVTVPAQVMREWAESDQVSIEAPSQTGPYLLIEKDFQCLHGRGEQDRDAYARLPMS
jgi:hypothetical protein